MRLFFYTILILPLISFGAGKKQRQPSQAYAVGHFLCAEAADDGSTLVVEQNFPDDPGKKETVTVPSSSVVGRLSLFLNQYCQVTEGISSAIGFGTNRVCCIKKSGM